MSRTSEIMLYLCAAEAGEMSVTAYLADLQRVRDMDAAYDLEMAERDRQELEFHRSVADGSYFKIEHEEVE